MDQPTLDTSTCAPVRIGIFDSGVGGLSVLRSLHALLPDASFVYVADSANAPYGERADSFVVERSELIARHLLGEHGVQLLVVACNTATAAAVQRLRELWPEVPIVGVEPGLKPAVTASRRGNVGILATPSTLRSVKFQKLLEQHAHGTRINLQPCPGLASQIETGLLDSSPLITMVEEFCMPLKDAGVDVLVLGCTHYAFAEHHIRRVMGDDVTIIDTADAVARHAATLASTRPGVAMSVSGLANDSSFPGPSSADPFGPATATNPVRLYTTGDPTLLSRVAASWLPFACTVDTCTI